MNLTFPIVPRMETVYFPAGEPPNLVDLCEPCVAIVKEAVANALKLK